MARTGLLGGGTINPFGGAGGSFDVFNVVDPGREDYLQFLKVQTRWEEGKASDHEYLDALQTYANAAPEASPERVSRLHDLAQAKYTVTRNVLVGQVNSGKKKLADLLHYDTAALVGIQQDSLEYTQRQASLFSTQSAFVREQEDAKVQAYQDGKMTTAQLKGWYDAVAKDPTYVGNADLIDSIKKQSHDLAQRVVDERDAQMISDFGKGKVTTSAFLAYATAAKARYAKGTQSYQDWGSRITDAKDTAVENGLQYRYNLSQSYAQLEKFVKSNGGKPAGGKSTSTSTRTILGADGQWHTVKTTTSKNTAPTPAEQAAYHKLQIEIADAKRQMAGIAGKLHGLGGFLSTDQVLGFYKGQLGKFKKGTTEWYAVQGKIDSLNETKHAETVLSAEGIKVNYPGVGSIPSAPKASGGGGGSSAGSAPKGGGGGGASQHPTSGGGGGGFVASGNTKSVTLDSFMHAIGQQESGGRYTAYNPNDPSGSYGKYQIQNQNWGAWARRAGLPANAPKTPENQEKVARAAFSRLYHKYGGNWAMMAAEWNGGAGGARNPGPGIRRYVSSVMAKLGLGASFSGHTFTATGAPVGHVALGTPVGVSGGGGHAPAAGYAAPGHPSSTPAKGGGKGKPDPNPGGMLQVYDEAHRVSRSSNEIVSSHGANFPVGLDGRAFAHFFDHYESAFNSGAETFTDYSSGKPVTYFIGSDPAERIDHMNRIDDLRISYYQERQGAYAGTATEISAANAVSGAIKDKIAHQYRILDTAMKPGQNVAYGGPDHAPNPIAEGMKLLDHTKAAVALDVKMAVAAFDRGDLDQAFAMMQEAHQLVAHGGPHGEAIPSAAARLLTGYAKTGHAAVSALTGSGVTPEAALGAGGAATLTADLGHLDNWQADMAVEFTKGSAVNLAIKQFVQTDASGNVRLDADGSLLLKPDVGLIVDKNGKAQYQRIPKGPVDVQTGKPSNVPDGMVAVHMKTGANSAHDAFIGYDVVNVGYITDAAGGHHGLMGKMIHTVDSNGEPVTWYENPLQMGLWSSTPIVFKAGPSFQATQGAQGWLYSWKARDGGTYQLIPDQKTGGYEVQHTSTGGLFSVGGNAGPTGEPDLTGTTAPTGTGPVEHAGRGGPRRRRPRPRPVRPRRRRSLLQLDARRAARLQRPGVAGLPGARRVGRRGARSAAVGSTRARQPAGRGPRGDGPRVDGPLGRRREPWRVGHRERRQAVHADAARAPPGGELAGAHGTRRRRSLPRWVRAGHRGLDPGGRRCRPEHPRPAAGDRAAAGPRRTARCRGRGEGPSQHGGRPRRRVAGRWIQSEPEAEAAAAAEAVVRARQRRAT
jgi:hypothetical protein